MTSETRAALASFWHPKRSGLDGFQIIRRIGTGNKRREIEERDIPALARKADRAMRRYIAESEERRASNRPKGRQIKFIGCRFADCGKPHRRGGYCDSHSAQLRRSGKLSPLRKRAPNGSPTWQTKINGEYAANRKKREAIARFVRAVWSVYYYGQRRPPRRAGRRPPVKAAP